MQWLDTVAVKTDEGNKMFLLRELLFSAFDALYQLVEAADGYSCYRTHRAALV